MLPPRRGGVLYTRDSADQAVPTVLAVKRGKGWRSRHNSLNYLILYSFRQSAPGLPRLRRRPAAGVRKRRIGRRARFAFLTRARSEGRMDSRWPYPVSPKRPRPSGSSGRAPMTGPRPGISRRSRWMCGRSARASRATAWLSLENRPCTHRPAARLVAARP